MKFIKIDKQPFNLEDLNSEDSKWVTQKIKNLVDLELSKLFDNNFFLDIWIPTIQKLNIENVDYGEFKMFLKDKLEKMYFNQICLTSPTNKDFYLLKEYYVYFNDDINLYKKYIEKFLEVNSNKYAINNYGYVNIINLLGKYFSKNVGEEAYIFIHINNLKWLPFNWLNNFKLIEHIPKGSKQQGQFNGPDFIFIESNTKKQIGVETTYLTKNMFVNPNFKTDKGWWKALKTSKYTRINDLNSFVNLCHERVNEKIGASVNYKNTSKLYLIIYTNIQSDNTLPEKNKIFKIWWPYFSEYVVNKTKRQSKFEYVFIL